MKTISFNTQHLCVEHEGERFRLDGETGMYGGRFAFRVCINQIYRLTEDRQLAPLTEEEKDRVKHLVVEYWSDTSMRICFLGNDGSLIGETVHAAGMTTEEHRKKLRVLIPFSIGIVIAIFGGIFVLDKALVYVMSMMLTAMGVTETGMIYNILLYISVCINAVVILLVAVGKKRVAPFMQKHSNKLIIALIINVVLAGAWVLAK